MIKKTITYALAFIFCVFIFGCASTPKERSVVALILSGKGNEAKSLFQSKYDINETDASGNTPLHAAALVDDADIRPHLHFKCEKCGKVFDVFDDTNIADYMLKSTDALPEGFVMTKMQTNMWGICRDCAKR